MPFLSMNQRQNPTSAGRTITITPDPVSMYAGSAVPELTYTVAGLGADGFDSLTGTFVFFLEETGMSIKKEFTVNEHITFTSAQQNYISSHAGVHTYSLDYLGDEIHDPTSATGTITVNAVPVPPEPEPEPTPDEPVAPTPA